MMLKISDFSRLAQVPKATLRYYDQIGLLKPAQVDAFTEYRYYQVDQLARLNRISVLKDLGFSLDQIARMLDDALSALELRAMLSLRKADAEREMRESEQRFARVAARLSEIEQEGTPSPFDIVIKALDPVWLISTRQRAASVWEIGLFCNEVHADMRRHLRKAGVALAAPPAPGLLNLYHADEYRETDIDLELGVVADKTRLPAPRVLAGVPIALTLRELPAEPLAACGLFRGSMLQMEPLVRSLLAWVGRNDFSVTGPLREIHFEPRDAERDENVVELQLPVANTQKKPLTFKPLEG